jgi:hypothetical protein
MNRPYSDSELRDIERELYSRHRLGDVVATHTPCYHKYRVKKGGRKEQHLVGLTDEVMDDQTCSVCFKTRTSGPGPDCPSAIGSKRDLDALDSFYKWLYRHDYA